MNVNVYEAVKKTFMKRRSIYSSVRLTMIFFFVSASFFTQAQEKAELTINIDDCREVNKFVYLSEIRVVKNGNEFDTLEPTYSQKQVLKDLEFGIYTLIYMSLFDKEEMVIVEITENKKYTATLCTNYIDYSKETYIPIIDQLKKRDSYSIVISSRGCFHSTQDTMTIKRNEAIYTISWGTQSKTLSLADIESIRHFEMELNYMSRIGCTSTDTYLIKYNETIKQINDGSCQWNGNDYLQKQLFSEQ